eukprot:256663-Pyramimonas_sp.AAC.1
MQLFNARRRNAGWGARKDCACSRGLACPNTMWLTGPGAASMGGQWKFWCKEDMEGAPDDAGAAPRTSSRKNGWAR